jgi:hypothetical protein
MSPSWAVSASDAVLAAAALWASAQFLRAPLAGHQRGLAAAGALLIASAAVVGCLRFAGFDGLLALHQTLSNQGAILGLPLILMIIAWRWLDARLPRTALSTAAAVLVVSLALIQLRPVSAAVAFALVLVTLALSHGRRTVPALMLVCMVALAWLATAQQLPDAGRLILLHAVLAALVLIAPAALPRTQAPPI